MVHKDTFHDKETQIACGPDVLPYLAQTYQQLYLIPGEEGARLYSEIVRQGNDAPVKELSHFLGNEKDRLEMILTPAGQVQVLTLYERADFELFIQIMAHKCMPYQVPATQGASILDGLINWQKIRDHMRHWRDEKIAEGQLLPDGSEEFQRFTSEKSNYLDALIVLSTGPYSNIQASSLKMEEQEWLDRSYTIRKYHECTHFFCRRRFREQINAVWDEVVADAVGITAAFGRFDPKMEELFFGICDHGYIGGRLENYVDDTEDLDALAGKIQDVIGKIARLYDDIQSSIWKDGIFDFAEFASMLEKKQSAWWEQMHAVE